MHALNFEFSVAAITMSQIIALADAIAMPEKSLKGEPLDTRSYDVWLVNSDKERIDIEHARRG